MWLSVQLFADEISRLGSVSTEDSFIGVGLLSLKSWKLVLISNVLHYVVAYRTLGVYLPCR